MSINGTIKLKQGGEPIVYYFSAGTEVKRQFMTVDMAGKVRKFRITINDEKGITKCIRLPD